MQITLLPERVQITRLPDGIQVLQPIPVNIVLTGQKYTADCKDSLGILVEGQGNTPSIAIDRLSRGIALQFRLIRSARQDKKGHTGWIETIAARLDEYMTSD